MKYLKRILEAFDFKSWKWIVTQDDSYQAEFTYDSIKYQCHVTKIVESKGVWEINFFRIDEKFNVIMTITGNSKAPTKIFSNVISITEAFIEKASPSIVIWKSIDNDRTFLYTKFGEYLANKFNYIFGFKFYESTENTLYYITRYSKDKTDRILNNKKGLFDIFKKSI